MLKNFLFYCVLWLHCLSYINNIYTQKFILDHCIKYWRTQVFMIMSLYGRIRVSENRYSRIFYTVIYSQEQSSQNVHKICRYYFLSKKKEQNRLKWNWFSEVRLGLEASNITKKLLWRRLFLSMFWKISEQLFCRTLLMNCLYMIRKIWDIFYVSFNSLRSTSEAFWLN